jgi:hypothetical protein
MERDTDARFAVGQDDELDVHLCIPLLDSEDPDLLVRAVEVRRGTGDIVRDPQSQHGFKDFLSPNAEAGKGVAVLPAITEQEAPWGILAYLREKQLNLMLPGHLLSSLPILHHMIT